MESSKRIIVVLTTILFLEASAYDSYSTFRQAPNNYGSYQQTRGPQNILLNNASPSTFQSTDSLGQQINYQGTNLALNSLQKSGQEYINSGSNFAPRSNNMGGANIGQESHNIGGLNIAQESNQFGGLNIGQRYNQFSGANVSPGSNQMSGTNIGQEYHPRGASSNREGEYRPNIAQGANQIGGLNIGSGANRIGGLGIGQGFNQFGSSSSGQGRNSFVAQNSGQQSNQFSGLHIGQGQNYLGGSNIGQDLSRHISGLNIGQGTYQFSGLNVAQGSSPISVSNNAQDFNRFDGRNIGQISSNNQFGGSNIGQVASLTGDSDIGQRTNIGISNIGYGSSGNVAGLNSAHSLPFQSAYNKKPNSEYVLPHNTGSNIEYGSSLNFGLNSDSFLSTGINNVARTSFTDAGSNSVPKTTEISVSKSVYGSNLNNGLGREFDSILNTRPSVASVYPLKQSITTLSQPQIPTNTPFKQNYDSALNNPTPTGSQPIPSDDGVSKFNMVHVPIKSGSQSTQTLRLPIPENVRYKVLHLNPTETSIPVNVMATVGGAESNVQKALENNEINRIENYHSNAAQTKIANIAGVNQNQSEHKPSIAYYNQDSNKNLPNSVISTLTQASQELKDITSTAPGNKFGNLYNSDYPVTDDWFNYNQPYYSSNKQGTTSASSANVQGVTDIYNINFSKNLNPNNVMNTLINAELNLNEVLKENKNFTGNKQGSQTISTISSSTTSPTETRGPYGSLYNSGYQYQSKKQFNGLPYDNSETTLPLTYDDAQTAVTASSGAVKSNGPNEYDSNSAENILPDKVVGSLQLGDLELDSVIKSTERGKLKYQPNPQNNALTIKSSLFPTSGDEYGQFPLFDSNQKLYYPGTNTWSPYKQPYGYGSLAPSSITSQSASSATASSSTSQNRPNLDGNYNDPNYYISKPGDVTGINKPQLTYSINQHNAPYLNIGSTQPQYPADGPYINIDRLNTFRQVESLPSQQVTTNTAQQPQADTSKSDTLINNVPNSSNYDSNSNNYPENYPDSSPDWYSQPSDYSINYSVYDVPPSYKASDTQKSVDTTNQETPIKSHYKYSGYLLNANNDTQPFDEANFDNRDSGSSNAVSTAKTVATADVSQSENASPASASNDQGTNIIFGQNYESKLYNIQPTDDIVINNPTGTGTEKDSKSSFSPTSSTSSTQTTDSNTSIDTGSFRRAYDNTTQKQSFKDNITDTVQDSMEYGNDNKVTSTASSTDTVVAESKTIVADSESQDINYHNRPLYYQPNKFHRYYGNTHPRYHRLNWNEYGDPSKFVYPHSTNYPDYDYENYAMHHQLPSTENEEIYYSDISHESTLVTDSESLYNAHHTTKAQASTDEESDETRQTIINENHDVVASDTSGQSSNGYPLNNQIIAKEDRTKQSTITAATDTNYNDEYNNGNVQDSKSGKLNQADRSTKTTNKQYLEVDKEQTTKVDSSSNTTVQEQATIAQEQDVTVQKQVQSLVYDNNRTRLAKLGTILNTRPDGTPYSCAVDVLMKIIDAIEKMLTKEETL